MEGGIGGLPLMSACHAQRAQLTDHTASSAPNASSLTERQISTPYLFLPSSLMIFAGTIYLSRCLFLVHVKQTTFVFYTTASFFQEIFMSHIFFGAPIEIQYHQCMAKEKFPVVRLSPDLWQELMPRIEQSFSEYRGDSSVLESAWGCLFLALTYGWRVVYLMHSQATIRKYEKITGYTLREIAPETTPLSEKSLAYQFVQAGTNFWRAVRGQEPGIKTTQLQ